MVRAGMMVRVNALFTTCGVGLHESVAWMLRVKVPLTEGVPDNNPLDESDIPVGALPLENPQVTGRIPPELVNWNE